MADAKIKKVIGRKTACNSSNFIYIYDYSEVMVKYEFSQ